MREIFLKKKTKKKKKKNGYPAMLRNEHPEPALDVRARVRVDELDVGPEIRLERNCGESQQQRGGRPVRARHHVAPQLQVQQVRLGRVACYLGVAEKKKKKKEKKKKKKKSWSRPDRQRDQ
jgi:hypothetical protein